MVTFVMDTRKLEIQRGFVSIHRLTRWVSSETDMDTRETLLSALTQVHGTLVTGGTLGDEHWSVIRRGLRAPDKEPRVMALKTARQCIALRLETELFRRTRLEINLVQYGTLEWCWLRQEAHA